MITDEERRQIADRLHEEAENWHDFAKDDTLFDRSWTRSRAFTRLFWAEVVE